MQRRSTHELRRRDFFVKSYVGCAILFKINFGQFGISGSFAPSRGRSYDQSNHGC